jgi:hypothetical protein
MKDEWRGSEREDRGAGFACGYPPVEDRSK